MDWAAVQERMGAQRRLAAKALGLLTVGVGVVLLRRPVPKWIGLGTLTDGVTTLTTGKGLVPHAWDALFGGNAQTITDRAKTPAQKEDST